MRSSTRSGRRKYHRRSDDERIAELEARIADLRAKQVAKERRIDPVLKEIPRIQRRLRKFVQLATNNQRADIANSTTAFIAGLERTLRSELNGAASRPVPPLEDA